MLALAIFDITLTSLLIGVVSGIGIGAIVGLFGESFVILYATSGLFNFALGTYLMLGTVASYYFVVDHQLSLWIAVPLIALVGFLLGLATERVTVRPVMDRTDHPQMSVVFATMGLALVLQAVTERTFGVTQRPVPSYVSTSPFFIGDVPIRPIFAVMVIAVMVFAISFEVVVRMTALGAVLLATQADREGAELAGISTRTVMFWLFGLAGSIATLSGFLVAPLTLASAHAGSNLLLLGFAAIALGGFSSFSGALVGGMIIGLVNSLTPLFWQPAASGPIVFAVLLLVLLLRPQGLFGRHEARSV